MPGQDDPRCFPILMLNLGEMNFESLNSPLAIVAILNLPFFYNIFSGIAKTTQVGWIYVQALHQVAEDRLLPEPSDLRPA